MKKLLILSTVLALTTFASMATADDDIAIGKDTAATAKLSNFNTGKELGVVPISFASDATWDSLKGSYSVSADTEAALVSKKMSLEVAADGTVTFKSAPKKMACKASCSKKK